MNKTELKEVLLIIDEINETICSLIGEQNGGNFLLTYTNATWYEVIEFAGICIWNSENEERTWIEETKDYEPFKPFLIREIRKITSKFLTIHDGLGLPPWK